MTTTSMRRLVLYNAHQRRRMTTLRRVDPSPASINISGLQVFASSEPSKTEEALLFDASPLIFRTVFSGKNDPKEAIATVDKLCSRLIKRRRSVYAALVLDGAKAKANRQQLIHTARKDVMIDRVFLENLVKDLSAGAVLTGTSLMTKPAPVHLSFPERMTLVEGIQADIVARTQEPPQVLISRRIDAELPNLSPDKRLQIATSVQAELVLNAQSVLARSSQVAEQMNFEYKGNRVVTEWRKYAIEVVQRLMEPDHGGFSSAPIVFMQSAEADDVIASLTKRILNFNASTRVVIASPDKDFLQLLGSPRVGMLKGLEAIHRGRGEIARDWVVRELGVEAEQFVEYQALVGDDVDNIPGVKGVGPKKAAALLREFGTLDKVFEAAQDKTRKGAMWKELSVSRDIAQLSKELATLKDDLDLPLPQGASDWSQLLRVKSISSGTRGKASRKDGSGQ